ncbi:MAG: HpcH/HpaI aldolase/citrate lyase family protein [Rhodobacterales bacterium]
MTLDYRSYLFVPADQPTKQERAISSCADALILDLEDSVAPESKEYARKLVGDFVSEQGNSGPALLVRVNALNTGLTEADVEAIVAARPAGIVLPKCESVADIDCLARLIATHGGGQIPILAIATETVRAVRNLMRSDWSHPSLGGLTWGAEDLLADMGALQNRGSDNAYLSPFRMARDLTLYAALEAGVYAVDAVFTNFHDIESLGSEARGAAALGFSGKMAIHPTQIEPIHSAFAPDDKQIEWAKNVKAALTEAGGAVTSLAGEMIDAPHLRRAELILSRTLPKEL